MVRFGSVGVIAILAILGGCGGKSTEDLIVGKWSGELIRNNAFCRSATGQMVRNSIPVEIEFLKDRTYTMDQSGIPFEGKWSLIGNEVKCTPETIYGRPVYEAREGMVSQGGWTPKQASAIGADIGFGLAEDKLRLIGSILNHPEQGTIMLVRKSG